MAARTEQEKYQEEETQTMQDLFADKLSRRLYFKKITFENVDRAKKLAARLKREMIFMDALTTELEKKIIDYENWVDIDTLLAMEVRQ